ncbi:maleylpyruvate isomerase family mycothiol-dependent enzyme [Mycobacterium sp. NPDC003323]
MTAVTFVAAARSFETLVRSLPDSNWDGPGLGDWDLRALVGHTSRSLVTVIDYLQQPAPAGELVDAAGYYLAVRDFSAAAGADAVNERGRQAGRDLGADPAAAVSALVSRALADVDAAGDPAIAVIAGIGIRLSDYLLTRVFELVVHGLDIARATGVPYVPPADALEAAAVLAARVAARSGQGAQLLAAMTGRATLPVGYSMV